MAKEKHLSKPGSATAIVVPEIPIRITVEVIIRQESGTGIPAVQRTFAEKAAYGNECPDNKFSYTITQEQASVTLLGVEAYSTDNPGESGSFTTCVNDPHPEPQVRVIAWGIEQNPGGRAALNLKFNGKNLTPSPIEFEHGSGGILSIHQLIKLPL